MTCVNYGRPYTVSPLTLFTLAIAAALVLCEPQDTVMNPDEDVYDYEFEHYQMDDRQSSETTKAPWRGYLPWIPCGQAPLYNITAGPASARVIGGSNQHYGQFPSYVRLYIQTSTYTGSLCGGTLISDRHVLTAAHCVVGKDNRVVARPGTVRVTLADHQVNRVDAHEIDVWVANICVSPHFSRGKHIVHDWAVLTLAQRVNFTDYIQPACLPRAHVSTFGANSLCWLVGEGHMGWAGGGLNRPIDPVIVQALRVHQVKCRAWNIPGTDRSRVCFTAGVGPGDSCQGDSGGPIFCRDRWNQWTLMAIVSGGTLDCNPKNGYYGLYTNVRRLLRDIEFHCFKPRQYQVT